MLVIWWAPDTYQLMIEHAPAFVERRFGAESMNSEALCYLAPSWFSATAFAILAVLSILALSRVSEFIYYQF